MLKKILAIVGTTTVLLAVGFTGYVWWLLQPRPEPRPLPAGIISATTPDGQALLVGAEASADCPLLAGSFEPQSLKSFCGVASGAMVLSALGRDVTQGSFFTGDARRMRSRLRVTLGGMTLTDLAELLRAHGARVSIHHADAFTVEQFRAVVSQNLSRPDDFLLVNYQREVLGQKRVGHISPLAAYDRDADLVLVMDTASHHYPHSWVPLERLHAAMATTDSTSGEKRGYLEVTGLEEPPHP
jgi:hypothetical protein